MDGHDNDSVLQRILRWFKGKAGGGREVGGRNARLEEVAQEERVERELDRTYDPGETTIRDRSAFRQ